MAEPWKNRIASFNVKLVTDAEDVWFIFVMLCDFVTGPLVQTRLSHSTSHIA